jgi:hypothetical protein
MESVMTLAVKDMPLLMPERYLNVASDRCPSAAIVAFTKEWLHNSLFFYPFVAFHLLLKNM